MKKLLAVVPVLFLASCSMTKDMTKDNMVDTFSCTDDSVVTAMYSQNGEMATLNVTMPKVGLSNQDIVTKIATSGSGSRYVNKTNPKATYEWHTKADDGIMTIMWSDGQEYKVTCTK